MVSCSPRLYTSSEGFSPRTILNDEQPTGVGPLRLSRFVPQPRLLRSHTDALCWTERRVQAHVSQQPSCPPSLIKVQSADSPPSPPPLRVGASSSPRPEFLLPPEELTGKSHKSLQSHLVSAISCEILKPLLLLLLPPKPQRPSAVSGGGRGHTSWKKSAGGVLSIPLHLSTILMASDTTHTEEVRVTRNSRSKMLRLSVWKTFCRGGK